MYVDLNDGSIKIIEIELEHLVAEKVRNDLSKDGQRKLNEIMKIDKPVFKVRLKSERPAKVSAMKVFLDPPGKPVKMKAKKYPMKHKKILGTQCYKIVVLRLPKPYLQAALQFASHSAAKESSANFRTTTDSRPAKAFT